MIHICRAFRKPPWTVGLLWLLIALWFTPGGAAAQNRYAEVALRYGRPDIYHEVIVIPGAQPRTFITFRIPNPLLVFKQDGTGFVSEVEVSLELRRHEETVETSTWRGEVRADSFDETKDPGLDLEGVIRISPGPGIYSYLLHLRDDSGTELGRPNSGRFEVPSGETSLLGSPFIVARTESAGGRTVVEPVNLGGHVPFGRHALIGVPVLAKGSEGSVTYRLHRIAEPKQLETAMQSPSSDPFRYDLSPSDSLLTEGSIPLDELLTSFDPDSECLCWTGDDGGTALALVDPGTERLESDTYLLEVQLSTDSETIRRQYPVRTHWRNMPLSLYDPDVAIRNLSFVEPRSTVRAMLRGSRENRIEAFRAYWKPRDPTPGTAFNELMAEYYRRIDQAAAQFSTGSNPYPDGLASDAARIYVLHGPPDQIVNSFPPSGGTEQVWTYPDGRRFVFWAASSLEPLKLRDEGSSERNGRSSR